MHKKALFCILLFLSLIFCACEAEETYDDGFQEGYNAGRLDAEMDAERKFENYSENGYEEGYKDGCQESADLFELAEYYAWEHSGCIPLEATDIIKIYLDPADPLHSEMEITEEEFQSATNSLIYFYEYLKSKHVAYCSP